MITFISILLLIMPWFFYPSQNVVEQFRLPQALIMDVMFLGVIAFSFLRGNLYMYRNKFLSWLTIWMFGSFIYYFFIPFSINTKNGRILNAMALDGIIHTILGLWAIQIILSNIDRDGLIKIAKTLCLSSVALGCFAILQRIGFDPMTVFNAKYLCANVVSACLDNPNIVGNYLALCFPLFLMFNQPRYGFGALLVIGGLYATDCHFAIALAFLSTFIFFVAKYRKSKYTLLALLLSVSFLILLLFKIDFAKLSGGMSGRIDIWKQGLLFVKQNVLFGHGIGCWRSFNVFDTRTHTYWLYAHNDWLERTVEMGVIWLVLALTVVINSLRKINLTDETSYSFLSMFVVFLVMCFGSFPFETPTIAVLGLISFIGVERL